ncbi:MAG: hypothetical protein EOP87_13930 [Verrucomicrobiaceae bacterium]|nr:MAG: hypothetical protein EOP87_13930 [Verrucomicrobiaceae bacterium]
MYTNGFSVDNQDRNDVVAFWHAVYQASEGYENRVKWTGNYTGSNGTVSNSFLDDVERRLNYFRAMSGVSATATVNSGAKVVIESEDPFKPAGSTTKATAAQSAALMLIRNFNPSSGVNPSLTHNPPSTLTGWSTSAWNAAAKGNFAFGIYGPGAVTEYMLEELSSGTAISPWNSLVGHRRWCLFPRATDFATGDQPGAGPTRPPTNVFYVVPQRSELLDEPARGFIAYPPAGYVPAEINSPYWSLSREGADFSSASVKMTDAAGKTVPIKTTHRNNGYGDPAIIWEVADAAAIRSVYGDTRFDVKVSGIQGVGSGSSSHSYSVTLINPDRITSSQSIAGPSKVSAKKGAAFTFAAPAGAEKVQVVSSIVRSNSWKEDAESSANMKMIDGTADNYALVVNPSLILGFGSVAGNYSFRLTFPNSYDTIKRGVPEQFLELERDILPSSKSTLSFLYRRGFMTRGSVLAVEMSNNGGVTWKGIGKPIRGLSDTKYDLTVSSASIPIAKSSSPVRIRFRYYTTGGAIYTHEAAKTFPTGIFLDDITVKNSEWLDHKKVNSLSAKTRTISLSSKTTGVKMVKGDKWHLRLRTCLGGKWFAHGPSKVISVSS